MKIKPSFQLLALTLKVVGSFNQQLALSKFKVFFFILHYFD